MAARSCFFLSDGAVRLETKLWRPRGALAAGGVVSSLGDDQARFAPHACVEWDVFRAAGGGGTVHKASENLAPTLPGV